MRPRRGILLALLALVIGPSYSESHEGWTWAPGQNCGKLYTYHVRNDAKSYYRRMYSQWNAAVEARASSVTGTTAGLGDSVPMADGVGYGAARNLGVTIRAVGRAVLSRTEVS